MKKAVVLVILLGVFGCGSREYKKVSYSPSFKEDPVRIEFAQRDSFLHSDKYRTQEELERELDSMTAAGAGIIVRGSDRRYDTIIDHVRYIYITEE